MKGPSDVGGTGWVHRLSECVGQLEVVPLKSVQNKRPCPGS